MLRMLFVVSEASARKCMARPLSRTFWLVAFQNFDILPSVLDFYEHCVKREFLLAASVVRNFSIECNC